MFNLSIDIDKKPPVETVVISGEELITMVECGDHEGRAVFTSREERGLPGLVAFGLLSTPEETAVKFTWQPPDKFHFEWELEAMREFVQVVLLHPDQEWWQKGLKPRQRFAAYAWAFDTGIMEQSLTDVMVRPSAGTLRSGPFTEDWLDLLKPEQKKIDKDKEYKDKEKQAIKEYNREKIKTNRDRLAAFIAKQAVFTLEYETDSLLAVAWMELLLMAENNILVKLCKECGRFFTPWPSNTLYCDKCKKDHTRQALYQARVKEGMTEEKLQDRRKYNREAKQRSRAKQRPTGSER